MCCPDMPSNTCRQLQDATQAGPVRQRGGAAAAMAGSGQMANVNLSRYYSAIFIVAKKAVWQVFDWLHHHHHRRHQPKVYVGQLMSKDAMKRANASEKAALEREDDPATMDIPLLYRLLQHTCGLQQEEKEDKENEVEGFDWSKPKNEEQRQSLEHQLYLIKEKRNVMSHPPDHYMCMSDSYLDALLQELTGLLCHVLREAGQRSARTTEEVDEAVANVQTELAHIQANVPPSAILPQEFALHARKELQEKWKASGNLGQQLSPPLLQWSLGAKEVTLEQLLQGPQGQEEPPQVLAVVGETGIGKSSLCWQVAEAWLQGAAWLGEAGAAVEVVVVVEWRQVFTRDLTRLLVEDLLPQTCRRCQPQEVQGLLGKLRVLWLLDGFEEASPDARELLHRLVELCSNSHVVVVTCQPEYREELSACLAPAATPCCVTHRGLTQQGFHSLLATLLQAEGGATGGREEAGNDKAGQGREEVGPGARHQAFLEEVMRLDPNLEGELQHNPLKLVLAVQLWEEGRLGEAAGASLGRLYAAIQEVLVAKLVARLRTKSTLTEAETKDRVRRWVAVLCREALAMWGRGCFVALDGAAKDQLKDGAVKLLLPYTDCFSIFLVRRSGPGPEYTFLHHTQQSVLATQHLCVLLLEDHNTQELRALLLLPGQPTTTTTTDVTTITDAMANITITTPAPTHLPPLDHFQHILIDAAASLADDSCLSEGRARVLVELLGQCSRCPWMEVVRRTACCPTMAREVRPHLPEDWEVGYLNMQAAVVLASIKAPSAINIKTANSPNDLPHLMSLLQCLAKTRVKVALFTVHSFVHPPPPTTCDSLLLPLCDPASLCSLTHFTGSLTAEGCRVLRRQQHNLSSLLVGVMEHTALEELIKLTHRAKHLQEVKVYLHSIFQGLPSKSVPPGVGVHLMLQQVEEKEAEDAVVLARSISHTFRGVYLGTASPATVCSMVRAFRKHRVRTASLGRMLWIRLINQLDWHRIPYFRLPLPTGVSLTDVYKMWESNINLRVNTEIEVPVWAVQYSTQ